MQASKAIQEIERCLGQEKTAKLIYLFSGEQHWIPNLSALQLEKRKKLIFLRLKDGASTKAVADEFHRSREHICRMAKKFGITGERKRLRDQHTMKLWREGMPIAEIANIVGISPKYIYQIISENSKK